MHEVTKSIEFDAAHRLMGYPGLCAELHGHRYRVEVTVRGEELNELGILVDFHDLKEWMIFLGDWDHAALLCGNDPLLGQLTRIISFRENPTAEHMAKAIFNNIRTHLRELPVELVKVRVYETPDAWADYYE